MFKLNLQKIGDWAAEAFRANSGVVMKGLSLIGLALVCKAANIPYQVLTEPLDGGYKKSSTQSDKNFLMYLMPDDPIEASFAAIYNSTTDYSFDSDRISAAKNIMDILAKRRGELTDSNVSYAINVLQQISKDMNFDSSKRTVSRMITNIGKGEY